MAIVFQFFSCYNEIHFKKQSINISSLIRRIAEKSVENKNLTRRKLYGKNGRQCAVKRLSFYFRRTEDKGRSNWSTTV